MNPENAERTRRLLEEFHRRFEGEPLVVRAPGRVNLIGEHTDYNEGFVLPIAIDRDIRFAVCRRQDRRVRLYSLDFDQESEFDLDDIRRDEAAELRSCPRADRCRRGSDRDRKGRSASPGNPSSRC